MSSYFQSFHQILHRTEAQSDLTVILILSQMMQKPLQEMAHPDETEHTGNMNRQLAPFDFLVTCLDVKVSFIPIMTQSLILFPSASSSLSQEQTSPDTGRPQGL